MFKIVLIFFLSILISCSGDSRQNTCAPATSKEWQLPVSCYFNLDEALSCSQAVNKPVLVVYAGLYSVADFKTIWGIVSDSEVKKIVDNDFIVCYLVLDDKTKLDGSSITIGQKNAQQQIDRYNTNAQPLYAVINNKGDDLISPIGYTPVAEKEKFIDFLAEAKKYHNH